MGDNDDSGETLVSKLDASNPLYLHPSDSSTMTIISFKLKGTENYSLWSNAMKLALQVKNKLGSVNGICERPTDDEVLKSQWDMCNSIVLTWILNSLCEELYVGQIYSQFASDVWTELKETYEKIDGLVVFNMFQEINLLKQNGDSVSDYYHKLNTLWKQLDAMVQLPSCSCQASKGFNDFNTLIKLMQFLMGLDDVYQPVRTNLLTREPLPSVKVAFSIISREESHRNSNSSAKSQGQNVGCFEIIGYPQGPRPRGYQKPNTSNNGASSSISVASTLTPEQRFFFKIKSNWVIDSGANQHMTMSDKYVIDPVDVSEYNISVKHPNGSNAKVTKIGKIKLSNEVVLQDVFVVPEYCDSLTKKNLVTGNQVDGLYVCGDSSKQFKVCFNSIDDSNIWYTRLGHPASQVLSVLKSDLHIKNDFVDLPCDVCHKAKQHREPFLLSDHKSVTVGELVHLDTWGSYRIKSKEGYRSFLTVVDDFSRAVWVFLIKDKTEVFSCIETFVNMIKNQFSVNIKTFRSDNGNEFVNNQVQTFFRKLGLHISLELAGLGLIALDLGLTDLDGKPAGLLLEE
ncbi:uncharacterized protein LOC143539135 [Bidens hawaiensis]|uniref:uncharacterized protein LOC143539135 n=1 Tax=Bidens hawaiensis TaxID=980011 RepID=UPI00404B1C95